jgi:hypothetical protein
MGFVPDTSPMRLLWIRDRMESDVFDRADTAFRRVYQEYKTAFEAEKSPSSFSDTVKAPQPLQKAPSFLSSLITIKNPTVHTSSAPPAPRDELTRYLEDCEGETLNPEDAGGVSVLVWWKVRTRLSYCQEI